MRADSDDLHPHDRGALCRRLCCPGCGVLGPVLLLYWPGARFEAEVCPDCRGEGEIAYLDCDRCNGTGRVWCPADEQGEAA